MSFLLIILYLNEKPLCSTFKCIVLSFLNWCFRCLSTMLYPHPDLVLSWISSLLASLRTLFPSCCSQILLLNYLSVDLAILPILCLKELAKLHSRLYFVSYLVLLFSNYSKFSVVNAFLLWCNTRCEITEHTLSLLRSHIFFRGPANSPHDKCMLCSLEREGRDHKNSWLCLTSLPF